MKDKSTFLLLADGAGLNKIFLNTDLELVYKCTPIQKISL